MILDIEGLLCSNDILRNPAALVVLIPLCAGGN